MVLVVGGGSIRLISADSNRISLYNKDSVITHSKKARGGINLGLINLLQLRVYVFVIE